MSYRLLGYSLLYQWIIYLFKMHLCIPPGQITSSVKYKKCKNIQRLEIKKALKWTVVICSDV